MPPQVSPLLYSTPPPKIAPADAETPSLAKTTDPIIHRAQQWLAQSLESLNEDVDMGWARYPLAMRRRGEVPLWQGGGGGIAGFPLSLSRPQFGEGMPHPRCLVPRTPRVQPSLAPPVLVFSRVKPHCPVC